MPSRHNWIFASALLLGGLGPSTTAEARTTATAQGTISGVVRHADTEERLSNAIVILQCTCLMGNREATTNPNGLYVFNELPPGRYTVQVLSGQADVSKMVSLRGGTRTRVDFSLNPKNEFRRSVKVLPRSRSAQRARTSHKQRLSKHRQTRLEARAVSPSAGPVADAPRGHPMALEPSDATSPLPKDFARRVVYSGTMRLSVFELESTKEKVETLVRDAGGYVQVLETNHMVLRIPVSVFRQTALEIGALGRIDEQSFEAMDVTESYYDLQTRIEVLRRTQTQLLALLDQARTVAEALEVRAALDEVTLKLESALGRQRVLAAQVEFSALTLTLPTRSRIVDTSSTNDPFPWVDEIGVEGTAWR